MYKGFELPNFIHKNRGGLWRILSCFRETEKRIKENYECSRPLIVRRTFVTVNPGSDAHSNSTTWSFAPAP